jgi:hypothetical protein
MFGGISGNQYLSDTWEWTGSAWVQNNVAMHPGQRAFLAMAYDPVRNKTVLFGGKVGLSYLNDTWEYDGATGGWTVQMPTTSPPPRAYSAMAFDPLTGEVLLFGGTDNINSGSAPRLGDTWTWNGTRWLPRNSGAIYPRYALSMATDPVRQRVVVFGGHNGSNDNDTWEWTGSTWALRFASSEFDGPVGRSYAGLAWNGARSRLVLVGGYSGGFTGLDETWEWNGSTWTVGELTSPQRFSPAIAGGDVTVLFGGSDLAVSSDTWVLGPP